VPPGSLNSAFLMTEGELRSWFCVAAINVKKTEALTVSNDHSDTDAYSYRRSNSMSG